MWVYKQYQINKRFWTTTKNQNRNQESKLEFKVALRKISERKCINCTEYSKELSRKTKGLLCRSIKERGRWTDHLLFDISHQQWWGQKLATSGWYGRLGFCLPSHLLVTVLALDHSLYGPVSTILFIHFLMSNTELSLIDLHKRPFVFRDSSCDRSVQLIHFLSYVFLRARLNRNFSFWLRCWRNTTNTF